MTSPVCRQYFVTFMAISFLSVVYPALGNEDVNPLAVGFGKTPQLWGVRISPDGSKLSFIHMAETGFPVAYVMPFGGDPKPVVASKPRMFDVNWCRWANNERLLCGFSGIGRGLTGRRKLQYMTTRLVAVNADGGSIQVLLQDRLEREKKIAQFQGNIIDWMPDDPQHVLIGMPDGLGTGVSTLNVYTGKTSIVERNMDGTRSWISDGRGVVRLRQYSGSQKVKWYYRLADSEKWLVLHEFQRKDIGDVYFPIGFGSDRDALLVYKLHDGRKALISEDLQGRREDRVIFSHSAVDIGHTLRLGKFNRLVAIGYNTEKLELYFFDQGIKAIYDKISQAMPGKGVSILDESWDKRFYLVLVHSDQDPGRYYRLDIKESRLQEVYARRPDLQGVKLAAKKPVSYPARDDVDIPGYLTLPVTATSKNLPTIILPHGGPRSRDVWDFDWLSQYMAARGYAVLQANFRGSGGYGDEWAGDGGFREWRLAVNDINDGVTWLVDEGISDPERICVVGWSYGGYAALLSVIEAPHLYQCVVSIAGVTDPWTLITDSRDFLGGTAHRLEQVGTDKETIEQGSPLRRASEFEVPVMLFHGDRDINVPVRHSEKLYKALKKADKNSEFILYKDTSHSIWRDNYRIDMLSKIGQFLESNIGSGDGG